ncbi:ferredoxin-NADP reductase [Nocardioides salarius]|uniref:Ferredoxin-NADP reductase n=1 Tax=Nocardioides salarius TaxID=374513 RepID=A0ABS2MF54_9ACTN|nr:iron-sulfur cluster-binding domain-containing protein [Nocardioides salarius]MBM7509823.1 ferredoxin-NADP reductase [Nocardioides salarius]
MGVLSAVLQSRAAAALASPHSVDRFLEQVNPLWAAHEVRGRVVDVRRETTGVHPVSTLTVQPTSTWRGHRAGQHVQVGVDLPGARRATRCFSVSSAASGPGERFTLTVRAHDDGDERTSLSRHLATAATPGTLLHLSQAGGEFTMHATPATPSPHPVLLISGGSGITPVMSMLRTLLRDGYDGRAGRPVTFLHYARSAAEQIYAEELAAIARFDNHVDVRVVHTGAGGQRFGPAALARLVPGFRDTDTWACGPTGLVQAVQAAYDGSERLRVEHFKAPASPLGAEEAEGETSFARSGLGAANTGETLLAQAEALGLRPQTGCRMGICFSCTTRKTSGTVRDVVTGEESARPDEDVRICVSAPVGSCTVDL